MKRTILAAAMAAITATCIYAASDLVGTTASNFLKIPPFARAVGMGEAFTAVSDGTYGLYYNPAGLASTLGFEAQITHVDWFQNMNYEFMSFVSPLPFSDLGKLGVAFAWFQVDSMNKTTDLTPGELGDLNSVDFNSHITGVFSPHDYAVIFAYGLDLKDNLSGGISLKYVGQNIDTFNGGDITGSFGFLYRLNLNEHFIRFGLTLSNLGSDITMNEIAFQPPKILTGGVSDQLDIWNGRLLMSAQAEIQSDNDPLFSIGAEYWYQNFAALRFGYKLGAFTQPTFGVGVKYDNFEFDYAFVAYDELGNTSRFSILYTWGAPPVRLSVGPAVFSPNKDNYMDTAAFTPYLKAREKLTSLKINIYDQSGALVSVIPAKPSDKFIQWGGADNAGKTLPDGIYNASLNAVYDSGAADSPRAPVEIDNTPPEVRVDAEPKLLKPGAQDTLLIPATFTLFAHDRNRIAKWQLNVWDSNRKPYYYTGGTGEPPLSIIWDGKGTNGEYIQTGQVYYYSLLAYDTVGNRAQTKPQAQVVLLKEIKLTFSSDAIFDLGQADVKISAYGILKEMKKVIDQHSESEIVVAGYTDNLQPKGIKYKDNTELSKSRADAVKFFMVNLLNMDGKRIRTEGYGELNPIASNDTEEGRLKNRRVEITIKSTIYK